VLVTITKTIRGQDALSRGSRGGATSRCGSSRRPGSPRAASGFRGGVGVAPSSDSSFNSPPSSLPPVRDSVNGDENPRRLGLGARGGTAAATYGRGAARGYVDDGDAAEARGAHCDGGHARRGRALASALAKEVKGRMTTATSS
jgi:hypothetical protein